MKSTCVAPANIALVKYWGRRDDALTLPTNNSISFNLSECVTTTTVESGVGRDEVRVQFVEEEYRTLEGEQLERVVRVVERIRNKLGRKEKVKIWSANSFPADAGIASSASAFAALTMATYEAFGEKLDEKELSIETRLSGSGSATRSIPDGIVEWEMGKGVVSESSYAYSLASEDYWKLADVVVVVDVGKKSVGSREGHGLAQENEYFKARLEKIEDRLAQARDAIKARDLEKLGEVIEQEAVSLHVVAMTSKPPIYYLNSKTFAVMNEVMQMRSDGLLAYFSMDAGPNVHVICEASDAGKVAEKLRSLPGVVEVLVNKVSKGARIDNTQELF